MAKFYDRNTYAETDVLLGEESFMIYQDDVTKVVTVDQIVSDVVVPMLDGLSISNFYDVTVVTPSYGDILLFDGSVYTNGESSIGKLGVVVGDVSIHTPTDGQTLIWNGYDWVNGNDPILCGSTEVEYTIPVTTGTYEIDLNNGNVQNVVSSGGLTLRLPSLPPINEHWGFAVKVVCNSSTIPTFESIDGTLMWSRGILPTITTERDNTLIYTFLSDAFLDNVYGSLAWISGNEKITEFDYIYSNTDSLKYYSSTRDSFGAAVGFSSSYIISGAWEEDIVSASSANSSGMAYIFDSTTGELLHSLSDPNIYNTPYADYFGYSVGISELYAIVGAYGEDGSGGTYTGAVYVYSTTTGELLHNLVNPNAYGTTSGDYYGYAVAISDTYCAVGAKYEDESGGTSSGKVYIFDNLTGNLVHTLDNPNAYGTVAGDQFGVSVSITDTYCIVGAIFEDDAGGTSAGKAYIFDTVTGGFLHTLDNPTSYGTSYGDDFGKQVSISDSYSIVGTNQERDATGYESGVAYVFDNVTGNLLHTLTNPNLYNTPSGDFYGTSVAISDTYAVVGAPYEDSIDGTSSGAVYIFDVVTGNLSHSLENPNTNFTMDGDLFGWSVGLVGDQIISGAKYEDDAQGEYSGVVYKIDAVTGDTLLTIANPNEGGLANIDSNAYGTSIAINDDYTLVGAPTENDELEEKSGSVFVYDTTTGDLLVRLENPSPYGTHYYDHFGWSVALSDSYAVCSAYREDDIDGSSSGKVYVYSTSTWELLHTIDNPNPYGTSTNDEFGYSVSCTDLYTLVSAWSEDDVGQSDTGKAYIFDTSTGGLLHTLDNPNVLSQSQYDRFGESVVVSDDYAVVCCPNADEPESSSGKVYVFSTTTGLLLHTLINPNAYDVSLYDSFGRSVSMSGDYCVIGSEESDAGGDESGKAFIYSTSTWELLHTLDNPNAYGTSDGDYFGGSVSCNNLYTVVGASYEDDSSYNTVGKAYLFDNLTGELIKTIDSPNEYSTSYYDWFGSAVAMSDNYFVVSAEGEEVITGEMIFGTYGVVYTYSITVLD